jgi:F-type H+-transporting ATPase subunit delta
MGSNPTRREPHAVASQDSHDDGVAGRYASALFDLALEQDSLDKIAGEVASIGKMLDDSADLRRLVRSPVFSAEDQQRAISQVLGKAGIGGLTSNFLGLLARNRRLFALADILAAFRARMARHRGEVEAEVTSAAALSETQMTALKQALKASLGKDVQVHTKVDPAILGGLIVKVGSRMVDSSIRTKLNSLKNAMKEVR